MIHSFRIANWFYRHSVPIIPALITYFIRLVFSAWIPASAQLGNNVKFGYSGLGVVIHGDAIVGNNVLIAQNVTIGGKKGGIPVIQDNVYIGAGAKILGKVVIGTGSIVGANAVVVCDVPPHSIVGGIPAKVLRENINLSDYETI